MRYHQTCPERYTKMYGETYTCSHPVYNRGTLFLIGDKGLVVIQQRYKNKITYWGEIDPWLCDRLYLNEGFKAYFDKRAGNCKDGLYPTVTIRQIMWALKMKPLPKERWETVFDRRDI